MRSTAHPATINTKARPESSTLSRGANGGEPAVYHGIHPATDAGTIAMNSAARTHTGTCCASLAIDAPRRCTDPTEREERRCRPPPFVPCPPLLHAEVLF